MLSGWMTIGIFACLIYMECSKTFILTHRKKTSWFGCLSQNHPYERNKTRFTKGRVEWKTHLLPHNLNVMYTQRNVFLNILFTMIDIKGKRKDTYKSKKDLEFHCKRISLELQASRSNNLVKPKTQYALTKQQRLFVNEL
ncbi:hypothetical protein CR513_02217, partial [Mucuna pruriens]